MSDTDPSNPTKRDTPTEGELDPLDDVDMDSASADTTDEETPTPTPTSTEREEAPLFENMPEDTSGEASETVDSGNGGGGEPTTAPIYIDGIERATRVKRSITERLKHRAAAYGADTIRGDVGAITLTPGIETAIKDQTRELVRGSRSQGRLLKIKPYVDGQSIEGGVELLDDLHGEYQRSLTKLRNISPVQSFEIWMVEGEIAFYMYAENEKTEYRMITEIAAQWPDCNIDRVWDAQQVREYLDRATADDGSYDRDTEVPLDDTHIPLPTLDATYLSAASVTMRTEHSYPLRSTRGVRDVENDPLASLTSSIVSDSQNHFIIQVTFKPARRKWAKPPRFYLPWNTQPDDAANEWYKKKMNVSQDRRIDEQPTQDEQTIENVIRTRVTQNGFRTDIRVIGLGEDKEVVERGIQGARNAINEKFKEEDVDQGLITWPENGTRAIKSLKRVNARSLIQRPKIRWMGRSKWWRGESITTATKELALLVHFPNKDGVQNPDIDWQQARTGESVPAKASKFGEFAKQSDPSPPGIKLDQLYGSNPPVTLNSTIPALDDGEDTNTVDADPDSDTQNEGDSTLITNLMDRFRDDTDNTQNMTHPHTDTEETPTEQTEQHEDTHTQNDVEGHSSHQGVDAQRATYPKWLQETLLPSERVDEIVTPSAWASLTQYTLGALLVLLGIASISATYTGIVSSLSIEETATLILGDTIPVPELVIPAILILLGITFVAGERYRRRRVNYVITNRRLLKKRGIVSLSVDKIEYTAIRTHNKRVSVTDKLRGVGAVEIYTSATGDGDTPELVFDHLNNVSWFSSMVGEYHMAAVDGGYENSRR